MDQNTSERPLAVTLLIVVVLIFTSLNILRLFTTIQSRLILSNLPLQVPPSYFIITGGFWGISGIILLVGLLTRKKWSQKMVIILSLCYAFVYWLDRLTFAYWDVYNNHLPFDLGLTLFTLIVIFWIMKNQKTGKYFNK
jgi:hypothetical protein